MPRKPATQHLLPPHESAHPRNSIAMPSHNTGVKEQAAVMEAELLYRLVFIVHFFLMS